MYSTNQFAAKYEELMLETTHVQGQRAYVAGTGEILNFQNILRVIITGQSRYPLELIKIQIDMSYEKYADLFFSAVYNAVCLIHKMFDLEREFSFDDMKNLIDQVNASDKEYIGSCFSLSRMLQGDMGITIIKPIDPKDIQQIYPDKNKEPVQIFTKENFIELLKAKLELLKITMPETSSIPRQDGQTVDNWLFGMGPMLTVFPVQDGSLGMVSVGMKIDAGKESTEIYTDILYAIANILLGWDYEKWRAALREIQMHQKRFEVNGYTIYGGVSNGIDTMFFERKEQPAVNDISGRILIGQEKYKDTLWEILRQNNFCPSDIMVKFVDKKTHRNAYTYKYPGGIMIVIIPDEQNNLRQVGVGIPDPPDENQFELYMGLCFCAINAIHRYSNEKFEAFVQEVNKHHTPVYQTEYFRYEKSFENNMMWSSFIPGNPDDYHSGNSPLRGRFPGRWI